MSTPLQTRPASQELRAVFKLAWPIALNALLLQAILIIDTMLITPLGEESLAAMGIAASVASLMTGVLFAFSNGTQLIIAQAVGAQRMSAIQTGYWCGMLINLLVAGVGTLAILGGAGTLLPLLAENDFIAMQANRYLMIFTGVILSLAVCQNIVVYFNASGNSRVPFYGNLLELPANALISYVLINGKFGFPALGLTGAALGTLLAVSLRLAFLMICLYHKHSLYSRGVGWPNGNLLLNTNRHFRIALPIAGSFISMTVAFSLCMMFYSRLGITQFAALTIIFPWMRAGAQFITSWAQATGILVGQLLGKNAAYELDSFVSKAWRASFGLAVMVSLAYPGVIKLFQWIYPELQPETVNILWQFVPMLVLLPMIRTSNTVCGNLLRAGGDAAYALKVHVSAQWLVTVPLTAFFVFYLPLPVTWIFSLILIEEIIKAIPFHRRIRRGLWKRKLSLA